MTKPPVRTGATPWIDEEILTDITNHKDRPGAGPFSPTEVVDGIPTNYYTNQNPETEKIEVVRANAPGTPDTVVREFDDRIAAKLWIRDEWLAGRLK